LESGFQGVWFEVSQIFMLVIAALAYMRCLASAIEKAMKVYISFFTVSSVMNSVLHLSLLKSANLGEFLSVVTYQCFPLLPVTVSL
jgi:hypothetical protein